MGNDVRENSQKCSVDISSLGNSVLNLSSKCSPNSLAVGVVLVVLVKSIFELDKGIFDLKMILMGISFFLYILDKWQEVIVVSLRLPLKVHP